MRSLPALCALAALATAHRAAAVDFFDAQFECYAGPLALQLPDTYAQLLELGAVRTTHDERVQQDRGGARTIERVVQFDGLAVTVYLFTADPDRYLVASVMISGPRWHLSPVHVGETAAELSAAHPDWPLAPQNGTWTMAGDESQVTVTLAHGRVRRIRYVCDAS